MEDQRRELPFVVMVASFFGFAKAAFLGFMGLIGLLTWDEVTDSWGIGALVLAALFAVASVGLLRGSRAARLVIAALAAVSFVAGIVHVFVGPVSAIGPSLVTAGMAALLVWLLYRPRSAREYFAT